MPRIDRRPAATLTGAVRRAGIGALAGLLLWIVVGLPFFVLDPGDPVPHHADVALVLGPVTPERAQTAESLLRSGRVGALLWSTPGLQRSWTGLTAPCRTQRQLTCFAPDPSTTQGEARMLRAQAAAHSWRSAIIITMTSHLARARTIIARCYSGTITMRPSGESPAGGWPYQYLYQTAATVKAWLHPGC